MCQSSFHGQIAEIPGISVDNFENLDDIEPRAYFLSHCHTDHTKGLLHPRFLRTLERTGAFIYTSELTAAVINHDSDGKLLKYLKILKPGNTRLITLPSDKTQNLKELTVNVTAILAGHSFGSVMFLFRTKTKTVLFTGDFRVTQNDVSKYAHLHDEGGPIKIDAMYVDTTFINARYENFPKRSESIECTVEIIKRWLDKDERNRIALHTSAKFGYESVFNEIFRKLGEKVLVDDGRWAFYSSLPNNKVGSVTNDEKSTKIHVCRNRTENKSHENCLKKADYKFLFVHFSAMKWDSFDIEDNVVNEISEHRVDICFATHCSRRELIYFVKYFSPIKVVGFPNEFSGSPVKKVVRETFEINRRKRKIFTPSQEVGVDEKVDVDLLKKVFDL